MPDPSSETSYVDQLRYLKILQQLQQETDPPQGPVDASGPDPDAEAEARLHALLARAKQAGGVNLETAGAPAPVTGGGPGAGPGLGKGVRIPDWADPANASVLDSPGAKAMRMAGGIIGAADPVAQVMGAAPTASVELPSGLSLADLNDMKALIRSISKQPLRGKAFGDLAHTIQYAGRGAARSGALKDAAGERIAHITEIGESLPFQANWHGAEDPAMQHAFAGDQEAAKRYGRFWGATSPNTDVPRDTAESVSAQLYHLEHPDLPFTVAAARHISEPTMIGKQLVQPNGLPFMERPIFPNSEEGSTGAITQAGSKVPNLNTAIKGESLMSGDKVNDMSDYMQGVERGSGTPLPLDVHAIWATSGSKAKLDQQLPALKQFMLDKGPHGLASITDRQAYLNYQGMLGDTLRQIAPEGNVGETFATMWEGARAAKGKMPQGGPIDILRKKGLLEYGAMLDPKRLREALQTAGWSAFGIAGLLKALGHNEEANAAAAGGDTGGNIRQ